KPPWRL
uniref:Tryptophyllin-T2-6 n=1 Tax=Pithecopus azureus TaxID=2034991 RepID=TY26_PITAZ|nr:RecName: Full=Tryptophyllin-T2-6; Short=Pha-T2-6; AltName: Full=Tryptophyllin-6 [Pithecopus azureus]